MAAGGREETETETHTVTERERIAQTDSIQHNNTAEAQVLKDLKMETTARIQTSNWLNSEEAHNRR